jgi:hypothetical protein
VTGLYQVKQNKNMFAEVIWRAGGIVDAVPHGFAIFLYLHDDLQL